MDDTLTLGVVILAGIGSLAYKFYLEKRRVNEFRVRASEIGFEFQLTAAQEAGFSELPLFSKNPGGSLEHILRGNADSATILLFKYARDKSRVAEIQTVAAFKSSSGSLPNFILVPEQSQDRIGRLGERVDVIFQSHPGFSAVYKLIGKDEDTLRSLFQPSFLELLEKNPGWTLEGGGGWLAIYRRNKVVPPENIRDFMDEARTLRSTLTASPKP